ncbi:MAG: YgiQ family radical SAM protein [Halobacteriota archaeon]
MDIRINMDYEIIFVTGEIFFDHPLCGVAILKRVLEKEGYKIGVIEKPTKEEEIKKLGRPKLFFGVTSGSIDSMVRNYSPLKKSRAEDETQDYHEVVLDRATTVFSNWIKHQFKGSILVLGGTEASLRRFVHYDYWQNRLRKPILFDTRADILSYGNSEKQILEIAERIKNDLPLYEIPGTCIITKEKVNTAKELPNYEEIMNEKERFCDMQNMLTNTEDLIQKIDNRYLLQYKSPKYTSKDLDEYYELRFTRELPKELSGFEFSVITHRGCIGDCNFCSVNLIQGDKIISRSEESILREIKAITKLPHFTGNIDDLGGPSANMYGMDCNKCNSSCIDCNVLDRSNKRMVGLLRRVRKVEGVKKVNIRSGIRFDLTTPEYIDEITKYHIFHTLRIAPEHVNKNVLKLMNKDKGDLKKFMADFKKTNRELSFYFMTAHPGSTMKEAKELARAIKRLKNAESVQIFTPTPMTVSTCMYYTGMDPKTKKKIYVPYTYSEKKEQKRIIFE